MVKKNAENAKKSADTARDGMPETDDLDRMRAPPQDVLRGELSQELLCGRFCDELVQILR